MKRIAAAIVALGALGCMVPAGADDVIKPEDSIRYRQSAMGVVGYNFMRMLAMVKGEKPYSKDDFAKRAANVDWAIQLPLEAFGPGTDKGGNTKAKPEIWQDMNKFKAALEKTQGEVSKLAQVAKGDDWGAIKAQFGATGKTCKACHDDFRSK